MTSRWTTKDKCMCLLQKIWVETKYTCIELEWTSTQFIPFILNPTFRCSLIFKTSDEWILLLNFMKMFSFLLGDWFWNAALDEGDSKKMAVVLFSDSKFLHFKIDKKNWKYLRFIRSFEMHPIYFFQCTCSFLNFENGRFGSGSGFFVPLKLMLRPAGSGGHTSKALLYYAFFWCGFIHISIAIQPYRFYRYINCIVLYW